MNVIRTWRDGTNTYSLILHDGKSMRAVYAIHDEIHRQLDKCGYEHEKVSYSIRIVGQRCYVERWEADLTYKSSRDKLGFRKAVAEDLAKEAWQKLAEEIRGLHSDDDDVIEVFEEAKTFVDEYEVLENDKARP